MLLKRTVINPVVDQIKLVARRDDIGMVVPDNILMEHDA